MIKIILIMIIMPPIIMLIIIITIETIITSKLKLILFLI